MPVAHLARKALSDLRDDYRISSNQAPWDDGFLYGLGWDCIGRDNEK